MKEKLCVVGFRKKVFALLTTPTFYFFALIEFKATSWACVEH